MCLEAKELDISILIFTKNNSKTIEKILDAIQTQSTTKTFEIIAVDSSSSDNTVKVLENHGCKIISILASEFAHGRTRNQAAQTAAGDILIFMNGDAIPKNDVWLEKLVAPIDGKNVATFSRQIPYPETPIVEQIFLNKVYSDKPRTVEKQSLERRDLDSSIFFSTVSAAVKRDIFDQFRFSDQILISEDQELAVRFIMAGFTIKYVPESIVTHSHSYSISRVFRRYFDIGWAYRSIPDQRAFNLGRMILDQCSLICESIKASPKGGPKVWMFSIAYIFSKSIGFALGAKANYMPISIRNRLSHTLALNKE